MIVLFLPSLSITNPDKKLPSICIGAPKLTENRFDYFLKFDQGFSRLDTLDALQCTGNVVFISMDTQNPQMT